MATKKGFSAIAHFHDSYTTSANGVSTALTDLASSQRALGHRPFVVSGANQTRTFFRSGVEISLFKGIPIGLVYPNYYISTISVNRLLQHCKERGAEIVHVHAESTNGFNGLYIQKILKIPCVSTFHTRWDQYTSYLSGKRLDKILGYPLRAYIWAHLRYFHSHADAVIAPSFYVKRELEKRGFERVHYVPGGVDTERFKRLPQEGKAIARKRFGIGGGKRVVLYLGRLGNEKNLSLLVDLLKEDGDAVLLIGGSGPAKDAIETRARELRVRNRVILAGFVKHDELCNFYNCADVFAMPSTTETQGLVVLEAMACGVPPVVFKGATSELVRSGSSGLVSLTREDFLDNVTRLASDGGLSRRLGAGARKVAVKNNALKNARRVDAVYSAAAREFKETQVGKRDVMASFVRMLKGYGNLKKYYEMEWRPSRGF